MGSLGVELLPLPSFDVLRETFDYDPAMGVVTWKRKIGQRAVPGKTVGTFKRHYFTVKLEGKEYILARIIWKLVHGSDPELLVDHINGNPKDNRLSNLRLASRRQNAQNRKSFKGNDACNRPEGRVSVAVHDYPFAPGARASRGLFFGRSI